jgi:urease accessory protein
MNMDMSMAEAAPTTSARPPSDAHYLLAAWFSPSYPVGAFSYSHGLEYAIETGLVHDRASAEQFIADAITHGAGQLDAAFLRAAYEATAPYDEPRLLELADLSAAFAASKELLLESQAQGAAFLKITLDCWPKPELVQFATSYPGPYAYSLIAGVTAAAHKVPLEMALTAYLHAFAANLISAAVRLVPLGQTDGQHITAALKSQIEHVSQDTLTAPADQFASATPVIDWCSMQHEHQYTRLFRS